MHQTILQLKQCIFPRGITISTILLLPSVFISLGRNYLYQLNIGMNSPRQELLVSLSRTFEFSTQGKLMDAGTQPAHNKFRSGRSSHQVTLTPSTALNQPISRQFTEMQKSFIHQYDQTTAAHFMFLFSLVTRLATTNKSIRALISLICYDYVRQESTVTSLRTTPSA